MTTPIQSIVNWDPMSDDPFARQDQVETFEDKFRTLFENCDRKFKEHMVALGNPNTAHGAFSDDHDGDRVKRVLTNILLSRTGLRVHNTDVAHASSILACLDNNLLAILQAMDPSRAKEYENELWAVVMSWFMFRRLCRHPLLQHYLTASKEARRTLAGFLQRFSKRVRNDFVKEGWVNGDYMEINDFLGSWSTVLTEIGSLVTRSTPRDDKDDDNSIDFIYRLVRIAENLLA